MFVLDTNTLIYFFKGRERVVETLEAIPARELCIPTVVIYELQVGIAKSASPERRTQLLRKTMRRANVVDFDQEAAVAAARIRANLERRGSPIGAVDMLIAGVAVSLEATLVTHNTGEFSRVAGLSLVDWF